MEASDVKLHRAGEEGRTAMPEGTINIELTTFLVKPSEFLVVDQIQQPCK